jgi:predicted  nucleic acid-binding Zn-ribbon protein
MTGKIEALLSLQEVDALLGQLEERPAEEGDATKLRSKRAKLARSLSADLLDRYEQLRRRHRRAVAPVRAGICLGCFTRRPTKARQVEGRLDTCERCGCILYPVERRPE